MELDLYYYFYMVCKFKSFSRAAKKLFVTQPAVSYAIKKLEIKSGKILFLKQTKKIVLTEEGEELYFSIKKNIENLENVENKLCFNTHEDVMIRIGIPTQFAKAILLEKIKDYNNTYKNIKFSVFCGNSNYLVQLLKNDDIDVLIDCDPLDLSGLENINKEIISIQKYTVVANEKYKYDFLSLEELLKKDMVVPGELSNCVSRIKRYFIDQGYEFKPRYYFSTTDLVEDFVEMTDNLGIMLECEIKNKKLKQISTDVELPTYTVYKIWKNNLNPKVQNFISFLN